MSKQTTKQKYERAAKKHILETWTLRTNVMFPADRPKYPGRITSFVAAEIDGVSKCFKIEITEFYPPPYRK